METVGALLDQLAGRVLRHETVKAACGVYTGVQCPWCPAVLQAVRWDEAGNPAPRSEQLALRRHVEVVHPEHAGRE